MKNQPPQIIKDKAQDIANQTGRPININGYVTLVPEVNHLNDMEVPALFHLLAKGVFDSNQPLISRVMKELEVREI